MARSSMTAKLLSLWRKVFCTLVMVTPLALCKMDCWARPYAAPGFLSDRRLFPSVGDPFWDGYNKVAFQNADCTWLAGNFRDTGSDAVMILFPAFTIHKEMWPNPQLQLQLAVDHNISSLSVDIAGRGESCGYEIGPGCTSTVILSSRLHTRARPLPWYSKLGFLVVLVSADQGYGCCSSLHQ